MQTLVFALVSVAVTLPLRAQKSALEEVATFPKQQVTGVTVSPQGRVFVNFPFWSDDHTLSVAEIVDGQPKPFPDDAWNAKSGPPEGRWICVQSVVVDDQGTLWILDPASPKTEGVVKGGPKLVKVDLSTNKVVQTIPFDETIAPTRSYLNDVRVDTKSGHAFITDSGTGAIVVVDLKTGQARRLLADHPSTKVEPGTEIVVDGMKIVDPKTGKAPEFHSDGIAFDQERGWLYYHPLTGVTLYRIKTEHLLDETALGRSARAKVEKFATTPKPDGMLEAPDGSVYLTAFEKNAIVRLTRARKRLPRSLKMTCCSGPTLWRGDQTANSTSPPRKSIGCLNTTVGKASKRGHLPFTDSRCPNVGSRSPLTRTRIVVV